MAITYSIDTSAHGNTSSGSANPITVGAKSKPKTHDPSTCEQCKAKEQVTVVLTRGQAEALRGVLHRVGGSYDGPRGLTAEVIKVLRDQGIELGEYDSASSKIEGAVYFK